MFLESENVPKKLMTKQKATSGSASRHVAYLELNAEDFYIVRRKFQSPANDITPDVIPFSQPGIFCLQCKTFTAHDHSVRKNELFERKFTTSPPPDK